MALKINTTTGLVEGLRFVPSPNFNERPENTVIDLLVIHNISLPPQEFGGPYIESLFTNTLDPTLHPYFEDLKDVKVSCHCLIRRNGEIIQFVPFHSRAWHAGHSSFEGRENCNDFSIGIELEGADEIPFMEIQYEKLVELIQVIIKAYPKITLERIVSHSDIAPERKTDPGPAFDKALFLRLLQQIIDK